MSTVVQRSTVPAPAGAKDSLPGSAQRLPGVGAPAPVLSSASQYASAGVPRLAGPAARANSQGDPVSAAEPATMQLIIEPCTSSKPQPSPSGSVVAPSRQV